jgi:hypothetical protein
MKNYLLRVLRFAFRGFAIRTDVWYAIISLAVSALTGGTDKPVSEITTHDVAWYFLIAVAVYMGLRLLAAPYYLWKEDQSEISRLRAETNWPDRYEDEATLRYRVALRTELSDQLAKLVSIAEYSTVPATLALIYEGREQEILQTSFRIREIISALSYDVALRVTCINLTDLCHRIMNAASEREDTSALLKRLWSQRKLTFRLLQRNDQINDLVTMAEIENLIEEWGESFDCKSPSPEAQTAQTTLHELRNMVRQADGKLHLVGRQPNLESSNRRKALDKKDGGKFPPC